MLIDAKEIEQAYMEKPKRLKTSSGIPVKEVYTPDDIKNIGYAKDIGTPGGFPFTRGIHPNMYRGRLWTKRQQWGHGSPEDTNKGLKLLISQGNTGASLWRDLPTSIGIDPDHPMAKGEVNAVGTSLCCIDDMRIATDGLPLDKLSMSILCASCPAIVLFSQYIVTAEERGIDKAKLRGQLTNDPLVGYFCYSKESNPPELGIKVSTDIIEYGAKNMPLWNPMYISAFYNWREAGALTAPQEIGFGFSVALAFIEGALRRGVDIDNIAPRASIYAQAAIDFFEEIAKLRAMRRIWARLMKGRFGAKDPRSWRLRIAIQTTGSDLVPQQPLNNIIRIAYQQLAAVLGGVQSITSSTYDEPICVPTKEAHTSALRSMQILAYETGVPLVADPLAGSYYVESLTNEIEKEATEILDDIESRGGVIKAIKSGWVEAEFEKSIVQHQKEIESKERTIVGVNAYTSPPEEDILPGGVLRVAAHSEEEQVAKIKKLKENRDKNKLREAIKELREGAGKGEEENLVPYVIRAVKAYATVEEIMGTIREAYGYSYDPLNIRTSPF